MDSTLLASLIGAVATISAAFITHSLTRRSLDSNAKQRANDSIVAVEHLNSRTEVFEKARQLVANAKTSVIDTTWGSADDQPDGSEGESLKCFLEEKERVINARKVTYKEIYSPAEKDIERTKRIESERVRPQFEGRYTARLMTQLASEVPMVDFLVVDSEHVILSCLSVNTVKPDHHYVYIWSTDVAGFFHQYFQLCWVKSKFFDSSSG